MPKLLLTLGTILLAYFVGILCARALVLLIPIPELWRSAAFLMIAACTGGSFLVATVYFLERRGLI